MVVKLSIFDKPNVVFYFDSENIFSQNNQTRSNECRDQISKLDIDEKRSFISIYVQVNKQLNVTYLGFNLIKDDGGYPKNKYLINSNIY